MFVYCVLCVGCIYGGGCAHTYMVCYVLCMCMWVVLATALVPENPHFELSWGLIGMYKYNQGQKKNILNSVVW